MAKRHKPNPVVVDLTGEDDAAGSSVYIAAASTFGDAASRELALRLQTEDAECISSNNPATTSDDAASLALALRLQAEEDASEALAFGLLNGGRSQQSSGGPSGKDYAAVQVVEATGTRPLGIQKGVGEGELRKRRSRRFWEGKVLVNRLVGCADPSESTVDFLDIVDPVGLEKVFLSSFGMDSDLLDVIFGKSFETSIFEELVMVNHYDRSRDKPGIFKVGEKMFNVYPTFPASLGEHSGGTVKYGIQHAKLMLLRYCNRIRIVVSSCNFDDLESVVNDGARQSQVFFLADIVYNAKEGKSGENEAAAKEVSPTTVVDRFASSLVDFIQKLKPDVQDPAVKATEERLFQPWIDDLLHRCDFSKIEEKYHLVASVPGSYPLELGSGECEYGGTSSHLYGLSRLGWLCQQFVPEHSIDRVEYVSSSVGSLSKSFWGSLSNATRVQLSRLKLVWPSMRQIVANEGISGTRALCAPPRAFQKWLVESDTIVALRLPKNRENRLLHAKCIVGLSSYDPEANTGHQSWAYVGSHNCSQNAWGRLYTDYTGQKKIMMTSFELGIFIAGEKATSIADLPIVVPSLPYHDDRAISIDGVVSKLGRFIEPHFRNDPIEPWHVDQFNLYISNTDLMKRYKQIFDHPRKPLALFFYSSKGSGEPLQGKFESGGVEAEASLEFLRAIESLDIEHPLVSILSLSCRSCHVHDLGTSKEAAAIAYQGVRAFAKSMEHIRGMKFESSVPLMVIYDRIATISLGMGRAQAGSPTAQRLVPVCVKEGVGLEKLLKSDPTALLTFQDELDVIGVKMKLEAQELRAQQSLSEEERLSKLETLSQKKLIIFSIDLFFSFKARGRDKQYPCSFLPGRHAMLEALLVFCNATDRPIPCIAMVSNAGHVGLRASMDLGKWGNNKMKYRTKEEEMSRQHTAHEMLLELYAAHGVQHATAKVRFYVSFAYRSHKNLSKEGLGAAKWHPDSSLREKYKDEFRQREYNQSWRKPNTGMIQQATEDLGVMVRPAECLLIGHDLYEDQGLATCLGLDFEFANPTNYNPGMFEPWVRGGDLD